MVYDKVVLGVGALAVGYLLFGRKGEDGSGGGGGGAFEDEGEDLAEKLGLDRLPLIINIPALPKVDRGDTEWGAWPEPVPIPDPSPKSTSINDDGPGFLENIIPSIAKFDILNELIGVSTKDFSEATTATTKIFTSKKGQSVIPAVAAGNPISAIFGGVKTFIAPKIISSVFNKKSSSTGSIKSGKGRSERVKAWKARYGEPTYTATGHRVKA